SSRQPSPPPSRPKWSVASGSMIRSPPSWARRIFRSCWRRVPAPSSSSATATAPAFTTQHTISTTRRFRSARRIGSSWVKRRCRGDKSQGQGALILIGDHRLLIGRGIRNRCWLRQLGGDLGLDASPVGELVEARAFQQRDCHGGEEWQALNDQHCRENVELTNFFVIRS